jgi:hypothetical protein
MSRLALVGGLLTLLAAALFPFVRHVIVVGGLLETFANTNQEGCSLVHGMRLHARCKYDG